MDWVLGLPNMFREGKLYNAVLTVTDRATRIVHFIPTTKEESAEMTAYLLLKNVICLHGLPRSIITDRGPRMIRQF